MGFPIAILAELAVNVAGKALNEYSAKKELEKAIKADPVLKNAMNEEAPYQSRVVVGSSGALLPAVGYLIWAFSSHGFDLSAYEPSSTFLAAMTVAGAGYSLLGRLRSGLKPLFSRG